MMYAIGPQKKARAGALGKSAIQAPNETEVYGINVLMDTLFELTWIQKYMS